MCNRIKIESFRTGPLCQMVSQPYVWLHSTTYTNHSIKNPPTIPTHHYHQKQECLFVPTTPHPPTLLQNLGNMDTRRQIDNLRCQPLLRDSGSPGPSSYLDGVWQHCLTVGSSWTCDGNRGVFGCWSAGWPANSPDKCFEVVVFLVYVIWQLQSCRRLLI